jgi:5-formyltetrahydrofolate cyclo-ligase
MSSLSSPEKTSLRQQGMVLRRNMPPEARAAAAAAIKNHVLALPLLQRAEVVSIYASIGTEVATHELIEELLILKKIVVLPRVIHGRKALDLHAIHCFPDGCEKGDFGILEPSPTEFPRVLAPAEVDLFLLPGLIFDRAHYRVGYGGGYYDRLLSEPHHAKAIGLGYSCQIIDEFEHMPWDQPLQAICTEDGLLPGNSLD